MSEFNFYPYTHAQIVRREGDLAVLRTDIGHLCGYCAFPVEEVPTAWHGSYDADALQYLAVHGGLTYCEVHGGDEEARAKASRAAYEAAKIAAEDASLDDRLEAYSARRKAADDARLTVPYTHVVFGFDCGHAGDDGKPELSDPDYVLGLAKQMRQQIKAYAAVITKWRAAPRDERISMIDEINSSASLKTEIGFGAMIGMLSGATAFGEEATAEQREVKP